MDIVSFETAKKLKAAEFPQPTPVFGQAWCSESGTLFLVVEIAEEHMPPFGGVWVVEKGFAVQHISTQVFGGFVYAPSATDILRQMPDYAIAFDDSQRPHGFTCYDAMRRQPQLKQFWTTHENPAEAAAEMYLSLNATEFEMKITGKLNDIIND